MVRCWLKTGNFYRRKRSLLSSWQHPTELVKSLGHEHLACRNETEPRPQDREMKSFFRRTFFQSTISTYSVVKEVSSIPMPESASLLHINSLIDSYVNPTLYRKSRELIQTDSRNIQMQQLYPTEKTVFRSQSAPPAITVQMVVAELMKGYATVNLQLLYFLSKISPQLISTVRLKSSLSPTHILFL